ncbi:MAG: hypothetical protein ACTSQE_01250, partial [Candidatus Heimdallarchaeaceae archaeon]
ILGKRTGTTPPSGNNYRSTIIRGSFCVGAKFYPFSPKKEQILDLLEEAVQKYGYPQEILTDNGALFSSVRGGTSTFTRSVGVKPKVSNILNHEFSTLKHAEK